MKKTLAAISLTAGFLAFPLSAKVSFTLDIEALTDSDAATPIFDSGLLVLVVDAGGDGFSMPGGGNLVSGNDEVVATWDLNDYAFDSPAVTLVTESAVTYESDWADDRLALFWYPDLSSSNTSVTDTTPFGVFSDFADLASGDVWTMPEDGTLLHSLKFFTDAAELLVDFGDFPSALGVAAYTATSAPTNATAPTSITVTPSGANMAVSWTGGSAAGGYVVKRKKSGSSNWETVGTAGAGVTSFTDSKNIQSGATYEYQLFAVNSLNALSSPLAVVQALRSRIINLASRAVMGDTAVTRRGIGFSVTGSEPLPVLVQAVGPSMGGSLPKPLDTKLTFFYGKAPEGVDRLIAENDEWDIDAEEAIDILAAQDKYGATVLGVEAGDSALLTAVSEIVGGYTSQVLDPMGEGGISSVQVYDLNYLEESPVDARMTGLSSRGVAGVGVESMRASFTIHGAVPMTVIVRVKGPNLRDKDPGDQWTSETTLDDPTLRVMKRNTAAGSWEEIAFNDNWEDREGGFTDAEILAAEQQVGLVPFDSGSKDSLHMAVFEPGQYTTDIVGVDGEVGTVTVEIYEVP